MEDADVAVIPWKLRKLKDSLIAVKAIMIAARERRGARVCLIGVAPNPKDEFTRHQNHRDRMRAGGQRPPMGAR